MIPKPKLVKYSKSSKARGDLAPAKINKPSGSKPSVLSVKTNNFTQAVKKGQAKKQQETKPKSVKKHDSDKIQDGGNDASGFDPWEFINMGIVSPTGANSTGVIAAKANSTSVITGKNDSSDFSTAKNDPSDLSDKNDDKLDESGIDGVFAGVKDWLGEFDFQDELFETSVAFMKLGGSEAEYRQVEELSVTQEEDELAGC